MRRTISISSIIIGMMFLSAIGNPLPEIQVESIGAFPPTIGVAIYFEEADISGDTIYTSLGFAVIDSGLVPDEYGYIFLDSSNTTGFELNHEGDWIDFPEHWMNNPVSFGNFGSSPAPTRGCGIHLTGVCPGGGYAWSLCFSFACWGNTNIVINEVSSHSTWNSNSGFIELYNKTDSLISLEGWRIVCDTIYNLPADAVIQPNCYYVIDENTFPESFDMDFESDNIYLIRPYYQYTEALVDQVGWSSDHGENVSFMRYPDGDCADNFRGYNDSTSHSFENGFPSRGAPNRHESPGFVVIGTRAVGEESFVDLYWTNPIWDEMYNSSIAVRSDDHFPETIDDGDVVYQGTDQHVIDYGLLPEHWYYYTVFARNDGGEYSIPTDESRASVYLSSGVGIDETEVPDRISYFRAYPNPFNAATTIDYALTESLYFTLSIYNLLGQRIVTLFEGSQDAGEHSFLWDASAFPSGVYFARLEAGGRSETLKMVLLK